MYLILSRPKAQNTQENTVSFDRSFLAARTITYVDRRSSVDVCPTGQTTGCRRIEIDVPNAPTIEVVIPQQSTVGHDYTASEIVPPITAPPVTTATATAYTSYTSYSQITTSGELLVLPIIVPMPIGEPIPEVSDETLDLPSVTQISVPSVTQSIGASTSIPSLSQASSSIPETSARSTTKLKSVTLDESSTITSSAFSSTSLTRATRVWTLLKQAVMQDTAPYRLLCLRVRS